MARTKTKSDAKRAVGYVRVSTDAQELGPEAQRNAIERWASVHGVELVAVFEDLGVSGATELDKRLGLLRALDALKEHGAGLLLIAKRDRLARDVLLSAMIERLVERAGARIVSADGAGNDAGPEGELLRHLLSAFAAYERALIRSRTRAAMAVKRARGEYTGGAAPYGYQLEGDRVTPDELELETATMARHLAQQGLSLRAIGRELERRGLQGRSRGSWHPESVRRLLRAIHPSGESTHAWKLKTVEQTGSAREPDPRAEPSPTLDSGV